MARQNIEMIAIGDLTPWATNARTHSKKQVRQIADSIETFGFTNPVLIDERRRILAGHGRVEAARLLGWSEVPCLRIEHMSEAEKRAYVLADNKLALNAGWDEDLLAAELGALMTEELDFDIGVTGFSIHNLCAIKVKFRSTERKRDRNHWDMRGLRRAANCFGSIKWRALHAHSQPQVLNLAENGLSPLARMRLFLDFIEAPA